MPSSPQDHPPPVLVSGAGPTGLACALSLTLRGRKVRIIEKTLTRAPLSKAFAVNARSLELLEASGCTEVLLQRGRAVPGITFRRGAKTLWRVDFSAIHHRYNFIVVLPQCETEQILEERLNALGVRVERGLELTSFRDTGTAVECEITGVDGAKEQFVADRLFGGDGAHSVVRHQLGIEFCGGRHAVPWSLADVELDWTLDNPDANVLFIGDGMVFLIRITDDLYRVATDRPDVLKRLPEGIRLKREVWNTEFTVSHRLAASYAQGRVAIGGDAAHLHSPLGGRGMNLGIEDAMTYAAMYEAGTLNRYSADRHAAGARTVGTVARLTKIATTQNPLLRAVRHHVIPLAVATPMLNRAIATSMSGLS